MNGKNISNLLTPYLLKHELVETLISPAPFQTYSDSDGNEVMDK